MRRAENRTGRNPIHSILRGAAFALGIAVLALALPAQASATGRELACPIPATIVLPDTVLPQTSRAVAERRRLVIMSIGGQPMTGGIAGNPALSYPDRMGAHLAAMLPGVEIVVRNRAIANRSARVMGDSLPAELAQERPDLVLWASGSREAVRRTDHAAYARVLADGIAAIRAAGADAMLMDVQYFPGWATIPQLETYREVIRVTGELYEVPIFPRHLLMQHWLESGAIDLSAEAKATQVDMTARLFDCIGHGLALTVRKALGR